MKATETRNERRKLMEDNNRLRALASSRSENDGGGSVQSGLPPGLPPGLPTIGMQSKRNYGGGKRGNFTGAPAAKTETDRISTGTCNPAG